MRLIALPTIGQQWLLPQAEMATGWSRWRKRAMRSQEISDLTDCAEFRLALQARPPRIVHGTSLLLAGLLAVALGWSIVTQADLVVRAPGRVRPVTSPMKVVNAGSGE